MLTRHFIDSCILLTLCECVYMCVSMCECVGYTFNFNNTISEWCFSMFDIMKLWISGDRLIGKVHAYEKLLLLY